MSPTAVKRLGYATWIVGIGAVLVMVGVHGFAEVLSATAVAGWGLLWVCAIQALPMFADAVAWRWLITTPERVPLSLLFWIRWIGEAVNNLLPTATIGGEFLRAWLANRAGGVVGTVAGASVVVDLTLAVLTQVVFTIMGLGVLVALGADRHLVDAALIGGGLLTVCVLLFFIAQRAGMFGFSSRLVASVANRAGWTSLVDDATALDGAIRTLYARRPAVIASAIWRLLGWLAGTLEVWAALWFLGHPVGFAEALMVESLVRAVRSAAFMVPGALGVQEGSLIVLGSVIGLAPDVSLALSLVKRVRELAWGLPGLAAWQLSALHRLWIARSGTVTSR